MVVEVIKYDPRDAASNDIIVYKHESEDFSCNAQLLVGPTQIALFINEGEVVPFLPGHYTLDDSNNSAFKFIQKWRTRFSKGESSFHCSVFFINLVTLQDLRFGTQNPIQMEDPIEGVNIHVRAAGLFGAHIDNDDKDGQKVIKFFTKVVGSRELFTKHDLEAYLRGKIVERVSDLLGKTMVQKGIGILKVSAYYADLSDSLKQQMIPYFEDFGIAIDNFSFMTINVPDEDLVAINEAKIRARQMDMESEALARKRAREGYTYQQEKGFDVMKEAAGNEGGGNGGLMGAGMGLGVGLGVGGAMGGAFGNLANETFGSMKQNPNQSQVENSGAKCPKCGSNVAVGAKFCPNCGNKLVETCPKCGHEIVHGAKFCPNCGNKLTNSCPKCGSDLEPGAKFCPSCGEKVA